MAIRVVITAFAFFLCIPCFAAQPSIKIGMSLSLSGKYMEMGKMQMRGIRLWEKTINKKGGLLKRPVKILIEDDQSSPEIAKKIYKEHIEITKVDLVIGPYSSGISEAILPIVEENKLPTLLSGASADRLWEKGYKYAFGVYTPASKYTVGFLQMLLKNNLKKIAIVSADDAFSTSLSENSIKWAKRFSLDVVYTKYFKKGKKDLFPIAIDLKDLQPDVVLVCGHFDESVFMRQALKKADWYPIAYYASVGPAMNKFATTLEKDSHLAFSSSQWEIEGGSRYPYGKEFVVSFQNDYKIAPSYHAATAYSAGMIIEQAVEKTHSIDSEELRTAFHDMDTLTLIGRFGVNQQGKQRRHFPLIIQWHNGVKKVVWPEEIKTASPIFN